MELGTRSLSRAGPLGLKLAPAREIFGIDLRTLALFRVLLGLYLLADLCLRSRDLSAHYTDFGVMPRDVAISLLSPSSFSIHLINGSLAFQAGLFLLAGACAVMLIIGWRTRLVTILSWALLLSLQNRNTMILSGEDNLALLLLFWAMFLPLGARYSMDAALDDESDRRSNNYVSLGTTALLLQGMSMYFFAALLKSHEIWIPEGTAVYYALQLDYMATPFALWFRQFEGVLQGLTYYVWVLELIGPILIFSPILHRPVRAALMVSFMTMHVGFWMCLEIGLFPFISIIMNLTFLPGWMWDRLEKALRIRRGAVPTIWYDGDCTFCYRICRIVTTFLFLRDAPIRPAQNDPRVGELLERTNSWVISDADTDHLRWTAIPRLAAASPVFWPLAPLLGGRLISRVGDAAYGWVARNRSSLASASAPLLAAKPVRLRPSRAANALVVGALMMVTVQNVSTLPGAPVRLPDEFKAVRQFLGLFQFWTMFAPYPEMNSPWPTIEGELSDGTIVDVYSFRVGAPSADRPEVVSAVYANGRWRKFLSNLEDQSYVDGPQPLALNYARYLCRRWSANAPTLAPLSTFEISFHVDWTYPPGSPKNTTLNRVWSHDCLSGD